MYKIWLCDNCVHSKNFEILTHLPFFGLPDDSVVTGNPPINSNASNSVATRYKEFLSQCSQFETSIVQFNGDDHTNDVYSTVNSKYYDIDEFNSLKIDTHSSFSVCHVNIASLDKHIDDLRSIISQLGHRFDVIGISEHKVMRDSVPANNVTLTGYEEFIFSPTGSTHGGTGFFIKQDINYIERIDLDINSPTNYETKFIEVKFEKKSPLIIGCIYRHPTSNISITDFSTLHIEPILSKISKENKQCILMGDFNINLLKVESNHSYGLFYITT